MSMKKGNFPHRTTIPDGRRTVTVTPRYKCDMLIAPGPGRAGPLGGGGGLCYGYDVVKAVDRTGEPVRGERTINEAEAEVVRRVFREFAAGASPRAIARLVWNRLRYIKNPETGKRVSRINPPEKWIVAEVPELRIVDDDLWQAVKHRQGEIKAQYATVIETMQSACANRLNTTHRPRHLPSGLLECGVCGGPYAMRGQGRYGCSNHIMTRTCSNGRGIRRAVIEERVLSGLKDRLMAPRRPTGSTASAAPGAGDRKELADIEKKIAFIKDGGYVRGMVDRLRELEARQDELNERLWAAPAGLPDIHPSIADIYRRKVARLAEALNHPEDRDAAASAIRGLIERIVLITGDKWAEMDAVLHGDLGTILEWAGNRRDKAKTDIPMPEMSVSVVAGAGYNPSYG